MEFAPLRNYFTQSMSLLGRIKDVNGSTFNLQCRSGDVYRIAVGRVTRFTVVRNLDDVDPQDITRNGVVTDDDLVTGFSKHEVLPFITAITEEIASRG